MPAFPTGPLKEVFQVAEERFPYGKALTTIASLIILITVILSGVAISVIIVGHFLNFVGIVSLPALPSGNSFLSLFHWGNLLLVLLAVIVVLYAYASWRMINYDDFQQRRRVEREQSVVELLKEIRDKLP